MAWIDNLLKKMVLVGASDLHLSSTRKPMLRIQGALVPQHSDEVLKPAALKTHLEEIIPEKNKVEFNEVGHIDFAYNLERVGRFRANCFVDLNGYGCVIRAIPFRIKTLEELKLPKDIARLCNLSRGLVLVTGPTGSGKSTTLAAMIHHINRSRKDHILTIEDPIEFVHPHEQCLINQREVGTHTPTFKRALRAGLREDPDIVLVGEMRDAETIEIALETAETGHLVFGTLHTSTAASTVDRVVNTFPGARQSQIRTMLAGCLKSVIAQTLCRTMPKGGISIERIAALELLVVTPAISNLIREGKTHQIVSSMQTGAKHGMKLLNDSLMEHVISKAVEPKEAYQKSSDKDDFMKKLGAAGFKIGTPEVTDKAPTEKGKAA